MPRIIEIINKDEELFEKITKDCSEHLKKFRKMMINLENDEKMSSLFKTEEGLQKFISWRDEFISNVLIEANSADGYRRNKRTKHIIL